MIEFPFPGRDATRWMSETKDALDEKIKFGAGSPEGVVTANRGCLYLRTDGGAITTLYVKTSNDGANTGWTAK